MPTPLIARFSIEKGADSMGAIVDSDDCLAVEGGGTRLFAPVRGKRGQPA